MAKQTQWRGQKDTSRRRLVALLALSVLLHAPLTPLAALVGLLGLLAPRDVEVELEELTGIPVALLSGEELARLGARPGVDEPARRPEAPGEDPEAAGDDGVAVLAEPDEGKEPEPERRRAPPEPDAGAPPEPESPEPDNLAAGGAAGDGGSEAGAVDGGAGDARQPPPDPLTIAGSASSVADPNANVRLLLLNDRIRSHPLGSRIGRLIARLPQWRSFFGPTSIDPIRDIDRMYVAGPQFRASSEVVAVLEHRAPEKTMREALDAIVHRRPAGEWLEAAYPVARARADRAERLFLIPRKGVVVMVPPHLQREALEKAGEMRLPPMEVDAALVAFVATPWRVFIGLGTPFTVPKSIGSAVILLKPTPDGGVTIEVDATDESPEAARANAALLTRGINLATQRDMGALGAFLLGGSRLQLIEPVQLRAEGTQIVGSARVTPRQAERILGFAESWLAALEGQADPSAPAPPSSARPVPGARRPAGSASSGEGLRSGAGQAP